MNKFCHNCGKQLPPVAGMKFCPFCNTSLLSLSAKPSEAAAPPAPSFKPFMAARDDDDYEAVDHLDHLRININRLEVEFNSQHAPKETIGTLAAQGEVRPDDYRRDTPYANTSPEQIIQELAKEGGSIRKA